VTTAFDRLKIKLADDNVKLRLKSNYMDAEELTATATPVAEFNLQKDDMFGKRGSKLIKENAAEALKKFTRAYNNLGRQLVVSDMTGIETIMRDYNHKFDDYHTSGNRDRRIALQMLNQIYREILDCYYETSAVYLKLESAISEAVYITERLEGLKVEAPSDSQSRQADPLTELYRQAKQLDQTKTSEFEDLYESAKGMSKILTSMEKDVQKPKDFLENFWKCWAHIGTAIEDYARALELAKEFKVTKNIISGSGFSRGGDPLLAGKALLSNLLNITYVYIEQVLDDLDYPAISVRRPSDLSRGRVKATSSDLDELKQSAQILTSSCESLSGYIPTKWKRTYPAVY